MTVAVNTRFLLPGCLEGIGWFSFEILRRLVRRMPETRFHFLFDRPFSSDFIFSDNVQGHVVYPPARHPVLFYAWFEHAIPRVLGRLGADVFMSTDGFLSLRTPVPTLLWWHDLSYRYRPADVGRIMRAYYQFFVPRFLQRADHLVTFSRHAARDLYRHFRLPEEKVTVTYGAARSTFVPLDEDHKRAVRASLTGGAPYFLYVGAIHPRKNIDSLIRAFDAFKRATGAPHKLVLAGRLAWQTEAVAAAYAASPFRTEVLLLGHRSDGIEALVGAAYAMVYPSFYEGFGLPVAEALQCGVPAIVSDVSSLPEVAGPAGLLIDPHDINSLAQAMTELAGKADLYACLQAACRAHVAAFDWELATNAIQTELLRLYKLGRA